MRDVSPENTVNDTKFVHNRPFSLKMKNRNMQEANIQIYPHTESRSQSDRRTFTLSTAIKSITQSRRKHHRRYDESPDAQRDWYHPRLFALVIGVMLLSMLDAFFTLNLLARGAIETNPVMDYFLNIGVSAFVISKMILTGSCIIFLTALSSYLFLNRFMIGKLITMSFIGYMVLISYELLLLSL